MITINVEKAREITHDKRRVWRDAQFAPYDKIIAEQIPDKDPVAAEVERVRIRESNAAVKAEINAATSTDELKAIIEQLEGQA